MKPIELLKQLAIEKKQEKYPSIPPHALPLPKYSDNNSNALTTCVIDWIKLNGGYAVRINTQGQYKEDLGKWIKGSTPRGTADVHACINGQHISIEVKYGKDKLSQYQIEAREQIQKAGGVYFVAKDFTTFHDWYTSTF